MLTKPMATKFNIVKQLLTGIIVLVFTTSCNNYFHKSLTKEFIDAGPSYSKAVSVTNGNIRTIYVAGLTGEGDDFETQTRSTFENIKLVLAKSGASLKNIVKTTIYIPSYTVEKMDIFRKIRKEYLGETNLPASTALGISILAAKDKLIEIEAVAVGQIKK